MEYRLTRQCWSPHLRCLADGLCAGQSWAGPFQHVLSGDDPAGRPAWGGCSAGGQAGLVAIVGVSPCACCGRTGPGQPAQWLHTLLGRGCARCCRCTNGTSTELLLYSKHSACLMQAVLPQLLTAACRDWETGSVSSWAWLLMSRKGGEGQVHDTFPRKEGGQGEGGTGVTGHWV